jgi:hypothetical protein
VLLRHATSKKLTEASLADTKLIGEQSLIKFEVFEKFVVVHINVLINNLFHGSMLTVHLSTNKNHMVIFSIDLGKTCGLSVNIDGEFVFKEEYKITSYYEFDWKLKEIVLCWKPDLILMPYPTRFYRVMISHAKMMGIVCLVADKREIQVIEVQDSTCKKVVLGSGKAKKEDIMKHFNEKSEHIADSMLFTEWYLKSI